LEGGLTLRMTTKPYIQVSWSLYGKIKVVIGLNLPHPLIFTI